jgi:hypothetical protein
MDKKKGILIGGGILGLVLVCGCCGGIYFSLLGRATPPVTAADHFLALLGEGKTSEAYASAATMLRNQQKVDDFDAEMRRLGLTDYASASWATRNVKDNEATLEGTMKTKKGGTVPLTVKLFKEDKDWLVSSVKVPDGVAVTKATDPKRPDTKTKPPETKPKAEEKPMPGMVPSNEALRKLTTKTILDLAQVFKPQNVDISVIKDVAPVFEPAPTIDGNGRLVVKGHYPAKTMKATFDLTYRFENNEWKLESSKMNYDSVPQNK